MSNVPPDMEGLTGSDISEMSPEELAGLVGGLGPEEEVELPEFIGVPPGLLSEDASGRFTIPSDNRSSDPVFRDGKLLSGLPAGEREVRFTEADVFGPLTRSGAEIAELQEQMVSAGLLTKGGYVPGIWDGESQAGFRQLLGYANVSGKDPDGLMVELSGLQQQEKQKLRSEAVRRATAGFVRADPTQARVSVKAAVRDLIRRDPTDQEMAEITAHWRQFENEDLAQQQVAAADQVEFEAGFTDTPPSATDVDPEAKLEEFLAQRFAGTIAQNQRVDEMQNGQHNLLRMADRTAGMMSRG